MVIMGAFPPAQGGSNLAAWAHGWFLGVADRIAAGDPDGGSSMYFVGVVFVVPTMLFVLAVAPVAAYFRRLFVKAMRLSSSAGRGANDLAIPSPPGSRCQSPSKGRGPMPSPLTSPRGTAVVPGVRSPINRLVQDAMRRKDKEDAVRRAPKDIVKMSRGIINEIVNLIEPDSAPTLLPKATPRRAQPGSVEVLRGEYGVGSPLGRWPGTSPYSPSESTKRRTRINQGPATPQLSNIHEIRGLYNARPYGGLVRTLLLKYMQQFVMYKEWREQPRGDDGEPLAPGTGRSAGIDLSGSMSPMSATNPVGPPTVQQLRTLLYYYQNVCPQISERRWSELCDMLEVLIEERASLENQGVCRLDEFFDACSSPSSPTQSPPTTPMAAAPPPEVEL